MTGRMYSEKAAQVSVVLMFLGFNLTFFTQFILGSRGMPRRYYNYVEQFTTLHQISTVGSWLIAASLFWMLYYLIQSLRSGEKAPKNPWGGKSLEWEAESPPPTENFYETPVVTHGPYDFNDNATAGAHK
jgi:cytochrome c oxidase subunit 1